MGFPPDVVHHKNWLTPAINLSWGVQQGCPLSYHLFNMVGQVLIYALHKAGFFDWWTFSSKPCSLYADDTSLFTSCVEQLGPMIHHIQWVGKFTGLSLNLNKMIAFHPQNKLNKQIVCGVQVGNEPVKYLGVFLGTGDLTALNFETCLSKARKVAHKWSKHSLTLPAKIVILKTFIFSIFVHHLNNI